jgi:sugar lactone lactonase YvrE
MCRFLRPPACRIVALTVLLAMNPAAFPEVMRAADPADPTFQHWIWSTAHAVPAETTSEQSGYFSIVEGLNNKIYVGTAKYGSNAFLVEFDPNSKAMKVVVDAQHEIGKPASGFAAQAKIHTRNNVGASGRIYFGTKQGYPKEGEKRSDYLGGYPMVFDPNTGKTRVYDIPIAGQGIISVTPDESHGVAYISTCSDERPIESTHFMVLDLESGKYRDLLDCRHMYSFIVVDYLGRAYHPILGGEIARFDPRTDQLQRLKQTVDGQPPTTESLLAAPQSHPINWDISPDRKTLYAVAMSGNQLFAYDLTAGGDTLLGRSLGPLVAAAEKTDCRAMCVAADGTVWAGVAATFAGRGQFLHVVSYRPGDPAPIDRGPIAISNPDYATLVDAEGKAKPWHHGVYRLKDGTMLPRYVIMGICAAADGTVYVTTLYPFTVHAIRFPKVAGLTTEYRHNSHADMFLTRLLKTDTLDERGQVVPLRLASVFTDQVPDNDVSRKFAKQYGFRVSETVRDALTLGTDQLAVDGVMLIAEHGKYPESDSGQFQFPKRRLFEEVADTFRDTGRVVPVFHDKQLADTWQDAKWIYDTAQSMKIPLMAGSSLPVLWRYPPRDVPRGARLKQIVAISYHRLDAYGFHALEIVQALAERRSGGETGVKSVQCLSGDAVWQAGRDGVFDRELLDQALACLKERPLPEGKRIEELAKDPSLFVIEYKDGLRANVLSLNYAVLEWAAAWRLADSNETQAALFWTQELRPFQHFSWLLTDIEKMMQTGRPSWPIERTLLTSGLLDALLISRRDGGQRLETPWLNIEYQSDWNWRQPPPPPPGRPITGQ